MSDRLPPSGCPVPHDFRRLHPDGVDRTRQVARIRKQLIATRGDMAFDLTAPQADLRDARRAVVSLLLNYAWEFARTRLTFAEKIPRDQLFWYRFSEAVDQRLSDLSQSFYEGVNHHLAELTQAGGDVELHALVERLTQHNATLADAANDDYSTPFLNDLNLFGTRTIRALHEAYQRAYGEPLSREEFFAFIQQPGFEKALVEQQFNDDRSHGAVFQHTIDRRGLAKDARELFADTLEGLSPEERRLFIARQKPLNPDAFTIDRETHTFAFRTDLAEDARLDLPDTVPYAPDVRNCPVVYTYAFHEMMQWLVEFVDYQLYDGPLPTETRSTQLDAELIRMMQTEIHALVEPHVGKPPLDLE